MDAELHDIYSHPLDDAPVSRRRRVRWGLAGAAALAVVATGALAITNGGAGVDQDATSGNRGLSGHQAPGTTPESPKDLGSGVAAKKLLGPLGAKSAPTTSAGADPTSTSSSSSTTTATSTAPATSASRGAPSSTSPAASTGAPTSTAGTAAAAAPATTAPPAPAPPATAPPATAPPATAPPAAAPRPSGGGSGWSPTGPTYWLAADGNDGADGSEGAPWRSFTSALRRLNPGDTLLVKGGTYGTTAQTQILPIENIHGTAAAPITVAAAPGQTVSLVAGGWEVVRIGNSSYVDVRGFDVSGNAAAEHGTANGIIVIDSHHIRVIANTVHDLGGGGIGSSHSNHVTVDSNRVFATSMYNPNQPSAISLFESVNSGGGNNADGFSFYVRNNVVSDNRNLVGEVSDGNCIIVDSNRHTGYSGATYIANNVCLNNGGRGVHVFIADNVYAINNTLVNNLQSSQMAQAGELSANQASNITFRNNLVITSGARSSNGARIYNTGTVVFSNNVYAGADPGLTGPGDRVVGDAGVNAEFVPQAGSPAIDAGTTIGAPTTDRRGRARVGAPDAGAYEG